MATLPGQEEEAPRYNHPCGDLLDSGKRRDYVRICVPLYRASIKVDLEAATVILDRNPDLVRCSITEKKETPLHVAAAVRDPEFLRYLLGMMTPGDLKLQNEEGNNAFCVAAIAGNRTMAMIMLQKNRELFTIRGGGNMMPLYLAAYHKQVDMITYLTGESDQQMSSDGWMTDDDWNSLFLKCIEIDCFDIAQGMLNDRQELPQDGYYLWNVLHVLAQKARVFHPKPFIERYNYYSVRSFWERKAGKVSEGTRQYLRSFWPVFFNRQPSDNQPFTRLLTQNSIKESATHLLREIWKIIVVRNNKDEIDILLRGPVIKIGEKDTYPSQILFVAAENGNANFLVELIHEYPDLIWKTNDDGQTIFHIGLSHHHHSILDLLLYGIGALKDKITLLKDKDDNTLLHSVSMKTGRIPHEHVRGASFQLLIQQLWFKRVRAMVPPSYEQLKNAAGQTPSEVFNDNHKDLYFKADKWIKETSNQCMVVATLITTISFSVVFTIPGGYNQDTGFPIFLRNTPFTVFVIFDGISFILSSLSILIFLPISFSRYSNYGSFHGKFAIGFLALLCSLITLMAAFSASFFVLYHNKLLPIIMSSLATLPIIIFFLMEAKSFKMDVLTITDEFTPRSKKPMLFND